MFGDELINCIVLDSNLPAQLGHGMSNAAVSNGRAGHFQACLLQLILITRQLWRSGETDMPRLGKLLFLRPCGHLVRRERRERRPHKLNVELDTAEKPCFPALWQIWEMSARSLTSLILEPNRFARDFTRSVWWVCGFTGSAITGRSTYVVCGRTGQHAHLKGRTDRSTPTCGGHLSQEATLLPGPGG